MARITYESGEAILFKRDTELGRDWEVGEYLRADRDAPGWHEVKDVTGWRAFHYVPSRRLKKAPPK